MQTPLLLVALFAMLAIGAMAQNPRALCSFSGDPHILTFDGKWYDVYGVAQYYAVRDEAHKFYVQLRTRKGNCVGAECASIHSEKIKNAGSASWTIGSAFSAYGTTVEFDGDAVYQAYNQKYGGQGVAFVNKAVQVFPQANVIVNNIGGNSRIRGTWRGGDNFLFEVSFNTNGAFVDQYNRVFGDIVSVHIWGTGVNVEVPKTWAQSEPKLRGLCGYYNGANDDSEFIGADGVTYPPNNNVATAYRVANYKFETTYITKSVEDIMVPWDSPLFKPQGQAQSLLKFWIDQVNGNKASLLNNPETTDKPQWATKEQELLANKACESERTSSEYAFRACLYDIQSGITDPMQITKITEDERRALRSVSIQNVLGCPNLAADEDKSRQKRTELLEDKARQQGAILNLKQAVADAKAETDKAYPKADLDYLFEDLKFYTAEVIYHENRLAANSRATDSTKARMQRSLDEARKSKKEIEDLLADYNTMKQNVGKLEADLKTAEQILPSFDKELAALDAIDRDLQRQREACRANCDQAVKLLNNEVSTQQAELDASTKQINDIKAKQVTADNLLKQNEQDQAAKLALINQKKEQAVAEKINADALANKYASQLAIIEIIVNKTVELESRSHADRVVVVMNELANLLKAKNPFATWANLLKDAENLQIQLNALLIKHREIHDVINGLLKELKDASAIAVIQANTIAENKKIIDEKSASCQTIKVFEYGTESTPAQSCQDIFGKKSTAQSGIFWLVNAQNQKYQAKCLFDGSGGWTLAMKAGPSDFVWADGRWTNQATLNEGNFDNTSPAKYQSWNTVSFSQVKLVMTTNGQAKALTFPYKAASLFAVFSDNQYKPLNFPRDTWYSLVPGAKLQMNCMKGGFNVQEGWTDTKVRIGIIANQEGDCASPDSKIGMGGQGGACGQDQSTVNGNTCTCGCDGGPNTNIKASLSELYIQ